jgi:hypothetical protein
MSDTPRRPARMQVSDTCPTYIRDLLTEVFVPDDRDLWLTRAMIYRAGMLLSEAAEIAAGDPQSQEFTEDLVSDRQHHLTGDISEIGMYLMTSTEPRT